ncbi:uncharacterized protein YmfQ (DUF2313 family) [Sphingomonas vulcanisoli]|uniref:Uncharacterized protein YmfQ (DUF2313 family) n=1 Tax=Sphingomonas vulcanisoli TaxID=1658060 RepID=A0ABX0TQ81_9SPHN|nr:putative phage tail protein [Sphingomonas vulcanisoli]NIJ07248.1 uncharacterized protein YmfQ (DUF2313 family) [Sphingomonas vulcanisoli]
MTALYSVDDYAAALGALMPRGRVWPTDPGSTQAYVRHALARSMERLDGDAIALLADIFPPSSVDLLPEWEDTLGLPDPCLGPNPTIQQRQQQVTARFVGNGGQSAAWYIAFAALLGFVIEITEYGPFRVGAGRCGTPLAGEPWIFTWLVTVVSGDSSAAAAAFRAGISRAGNPLSSAASGRAALECELRRIAPGHTNILFAA